MTTISSSTTTINNQNTTTVSVPPTTAVTNSTTVTSSGQNTTVFSTKATTLVTNSTTIDTTDQNTTVISTTPTTIVTSPTTTVQNTTTTPASVVTTQSTTNNHTGTMNTTAATQPPTSASTILTTAVPSPTDLTTSATTTNATQSTETPTTTANEETTTITTNSTTVITAAATTTTSAATTLPTTTTSGKVTSTPATTRETQPPLTTSVTQQPGFTVELSIRLNREYLVAFNDPTSSEYQQLKTQLEAVFQEQYKGITGFVTVFVTSFRQGSTITDYVVQTTSFDSDEMAKANEGLPAAVEPVAPVIGSVTAFHTSLIPISFPALTYTGQAITLMCGPPPENINMGEISGSDWKFKGRDIKDSGKFRITTSSNSATLTINNAIAADSGRYECSLKGRVINFLQKGDLKRDTIEQAPIVRVQNEVNVQCTEGKIQQLQCCVQSAYEVRWFQGSDDLTSDVVAAQTNDSCIKYDYKLESCSGPEEQKIQFTCRVVNPSGYESTTTMTIFRESITCNDPQYGNGRENDISKIGCGAGQVGSKSAVCEANGEWRLLEDTCIVTEIKDFLTESQTLVVEAVPEFVESLNDVVQNEELQTEITNSTATISAIVDILDVIANVSNVINEPVMQDILATVDVIISDEARESWDILNANETSNASSVLLGSLESISDVLEGEFTISTPRILLIRTAFNNSFRADLNSSIVIDIPDTNLNNLFITTITFSSLDNVLPARNASFNVSSFDATSNETVSDNAINAAVVLVKLNATINNVTLSFDKTNNSLTLDPQCVFWNFTLFDNIGGWDQEGCTFVSDINNTVTCNCNHLTSFSILMATSIPQSLRDILDVITFVGVGISLASLVICLIIEGFVWKAMTRNSTSFMRHVSIVNIAVSLLIANICFIIGAAIAKNPLENPGEDYEVPVGPCSTATFFMHFFYLALFFWMLVSGLLLFYRTVMVFSHMSKSVMIAIGFTLGYGCPLIIAVVTVASTASGNGYIQKREACWLNWDETKALLAFVIPALTIVFINFLILIVVLFKMLRRGVGDSVQPDEKSAVVVIARCLAILTPLFGLTWALGVGTMTNPTNKGIHIAFAFFNSLQGFFILVFGTLLDSKIRAALARRLPSSSTGSHQTRSTSGGNSSSSGLDFLRRIRGRRNIYHVSEAANSSHSGASESFMNI
uniref:adhesion G-protein coupled receptor F1 n=1 Tax=Centroberyx gerrardi TaxID=166262 RepID=UPI003AAD8E89